MRGISGDSMVLFAEKSLLQCLLTKITEGCPIRMIKMQSTQRKAFKPTRMKKHDTRMAANPASPPDSWSFAAHLAWIRVNHHQPLLISCVSPSAAAAYSQPVRFEGMLWRSRLHLHIRALFLEGGQGGFVGWFGAVADYF